jgi:integrase
MDRKPVSAYQLHKASGQAVAYVWKNGKKVAKYLGPFGSPASHRRHARILAAVPPAPPVPGTVAALVQAFLDHAAVYYRKLDGTPTRQDENIRNACRPLLKLYGDTPADAFNRLALVSVRDAMIGAGLCRGVVNQRIGQIRLVFRWAAEVGLCRDEIPAALMLLRPLQRGRCAARETDPVLPVAWEHVAATLDYLSPVPRRVVLFCWFTGARVGEAVRMRRSDLTYPDSSICLYRVPSHKAERTHARVIVIGPLAAKQLGDTDPCFPGRAGCYTSHAISTAVRRAAKKAQVPHWHPHQLRHSWATRVEAAFGREAAKLSLGHTDPRTTSRYVVPDLGPAVKAALTLG